MIYLFIFVFLFQSRADTLPSCFDLRSRTQWTAPDATACDNSFSDSARPLHTDDSVVPIATMEGELCLHKLVSNTSLFLLLYHNSHLRLALPFLMTDTHFLLSKAVVLHLFTPVLLKSRSTSSVHLNLGLLFISLLLIWFPVPSLMSFHHHSYNIPKQFKTVYFNYN